MGEDYTKIFLVNYYPPCPQPHLAMGTTKHTDIGLVTLLVQDAIPGLQVRNKHGEWIIVEPIEGSIIVMVANQLEIMTNGRYKSFEHQAVMNDISSRMSIVDFLNPPNDLPIAPIPDVLGPTEQPKYVPCTYRSYLEKSVSHGYNGNDILKSLSVQ